MRSTALIRLATVALLFSIAIGTNTFSYAASTTTGFLTLNPWLDDGGPPPTGENWSFNSPWQLEQNVASGAALFVTGSSNQPGFYAAEASSRDLTAESNVTSLDGYNSSTTELTDLVFSDPWRVAHFGTVPSDGDYNYFIEFTIDTPSGFYRATTQKIDRAIAFQNSASQLGFNFAWQGGGFLGDPFAGGNGIALDQILDIDYNVFVEVITPTTGGDGFFLVEGFNLEYEVTSTPVPEPTSLVFAGMMGLVGLCTLRVRK